MKLMKRTNTYKANNVTMNMNTMEAHSYSWWKFVAVVEGKLVFNNYRYSPSTGMHQYKVKGLLNDLGIKVDVMLPIPGGIKEGQTLAELYVIAEEYLCDEYLRSEIKREQRNEKARLARQAKKQSTLTLVG